MRRPQTTSQTGWTLLELLLVLVCVAGLTAILLYSFVTPANRQMSKQQVVSQVSLLVDAAHLWRHDPNNNHSYKNISIKTLQESALISSDFDTNKMPNHYEVSPYTDDNLLACKRENSCVMITVSQLPKACQYVVALDKAGSIATYPDANFCLQNPDQNILSFKVIYD